MEQSDQICSKETRLYVAESRGGQCDGSIPLLDLSWDLSLLCHVQHHSCGCRCCSTGMLLLPKANCKGKSLLEAQLPFYRGKKSLV